MNLYERIKDMDIDEMAESITMIVYGSVYASNGIRNLATPDRIKSDPNYEKALARAKNLLLDEQYG